MGFWTLEYGGLEKRFEDWGIAQNNCRRQRVSMRPDVLSLFVPGAMDGAALFAYGEAVIVRRDRTAAVGGGFEGGTTWFQGKATLPRRSGRGQAEGIEYQIAGPWWDFERLVHQQSWKVFTGDPDSLGTAYVSELFMGLTVDGERLNTGEQIEEAVNWAASCGVAVQVGTIDPATVFPIYNARDLTVAEVIQQMVQWTPDVLCWFDYSTTPATFHCRKLANLTNVTVAASDGAISQVDLLPRNDLVLPAVVLRFKKTNTVDGRAWIVVDEQKAPGGATGAELGAAVHTIELQGSQQANVYGALECVAVDAQSVTAADRVTWWKVKEPNFASAKIDAGSLAITSATVTDEAGSALSLATWPNELVNGQVAPWMKLEDSTVVVETAAIVKAVATFDLYADDDHKVLVQKGRTKELSVRVRLTNGITGTYWAVKSFTAAETEPAGLAADIYAAHSVLQYEGELVLVGSEVPSNLAMGNKLTINTGSVTYANLLVQAVSEDLGSGRMTLRVGPAAQVGIPDLIGRLLQNRYRLTYNMPESRTAAAGQSAVSVQLGKGTAKENTTAGLGNSQAFAVSAPASGGNICVGTIDAANQQFVIQTVVPATGAQAASTPSVKIPLADLGTREMNLQWLHFNDPNNSCAAMKMLVLGTAPEEDV